MSRESSLVSTQWVEDNLTSENVVIIEVDEDVSAYHRCHIPGALTLDWRRDLQSATSRDVVEPERFAELLTERGITTDTTVVLYGANHNWFAAYAFWYFTYYCHDNVRLMDGGRMKWESDGRELTREVPQVTPPAVAYPVPDINSSIRAMRDEVISRPGNTVLIDVRSVDEFSGKLAAPAHFPQEQAQQRGHIPGAVNIPWHAATANDGTFRSDAELAEIYSACMQDSQASSIAYCRIGERSSHTWFVLARLLGLGNVKNYDGSWVEYGSMVGVPVAR